MFIFLTAAAGAGVVSADFLALDFLSLFTGAAAAAGCGNFGHRRGRLFGRRRLGHRDIENVVHYIMTDA